MKSGKLSGEWCVIFAGICWGMIGIFTRQMSAAGLSSLQITFIRNIIAAAVMALIICVKDKTLLKVQCKDPWMFFGTGICSVAFFNICYFKTIEMTSLSVASILLYTAPAMVVVLGAIIFKEKLNRKKLVALFCAFAGCVFTTGILGSRLSISKAGILVGLGSGLGYALYSIFGTFAVKKYDTFTITFYTFFIAAIGLLPFSKCSSVVSVFQIQPKVIIIGILLAVISTVTPFLFYTKGLRTMEAGKASIIAFTEPMVATICGIIVFREQITISNIVGIILIFVSLVLLHQGRG